MTENEILWWVACAYCSGHILDKQLAVKVGVCKVQNDDDEACNCEIWVHKTCYAPNVVITHNHTGTAQAEDLPKEDEPKTAREWRRQWQRHTGAN